MNDLLEITAGRIIINDIRTWPDDLKQHFKVNYALINSYLEFEREVDIKAIKDIFLRLKKPINPFAREWDSFFNAMESILDKYRIVGFHCSRLTEEEQIDIRANNLQPLSIERTKARLDKLYRNNVLSKEQYEILLHNNVVEDNGRKGKVYCFLHSSTLLDERGLERFFRCWGGEALYYNHEESKIAKILHKIGEPCIVVLDLNYRDIQEKINDFHNTNSVLIKTYIARKEDTVHDRDYIFYEPQKVLEIINPTDPIFERLTNYSRWRL